MWFIFIIWLVVDGNARYCEIVFNLLFDQEKYLPLFQNTKTLSRNQCKGRVLAKTPALVITPYIWNLELLWRNELTFQIKRNYINIIILKSRTEVPHFSVFGRDCHFPLYKFLLLCWLILEDNCELFLNEEVLFNSMNGDGG